MNTKIYLLGVAAALLLFTNGARADAPAPAVAPDSGTPPEHVAAPPTSAPVALSAEQIKAFRDYLADARTQAGLPGLAIALVQPQGSLILEGFGVRSITADAAVTPDTRFALGAVTQALNSLLLARLDEQHALDLDAPARRCWDDFKLNDALATRNVTLRQLLTMTAGISTPADEPLSLPRTTPADLFTALAQLPVFAQPGDAYASSDASPAAAGYLAVYALNQRHAPDAGLPAAYAALAKAKLFDPLGMTRASFDPPGPPLADDDAAGHTRDDAGAWQLALAAPAAGALLPARGLRLSARDAAAWLQLELSGGVAPGGARLLERDAVERRWQPPAARNTQQYAMGWVRQIYDGREMLVSHGEANYQTALVVIIPEYQTGLAVLVNASGHDADVFLQDALLNFSGLLHDAATEKAAP